MTRTNRIEELDGLRGIAAFSVILFHFTTRLNSKFTDVKVDPVIDFKHGHYGVDLFFIISGFVIIMTLDRIQGPWEFACKRFIRLYPTFWICLLMTYFFVNQFGPSTLHRSSFELLVNFTMLPSLFHTKAVDGVYWTLLIEMAFYFLVFIILVLKSKKHVSFYCFIYLLVAFCYFNIFHYRPYVYYGSLFIAGIHLYKIWNGDIHWTNHLPIAGSFLLVCYSLNLTATLISLACILLFYLFIYGGADFLKNKALTFLGQISYPLYLLHQNIGHAIQLKLVDFGITSSSLLLCIPLLFTILLAYLVSVYMEKPVVSYLSSSYKKLSLTN